MSFISLGKIDKTLIVIIIGGIFCFLNRIINQVDCELFKNPILTVISISPSKFLTLIPFIILKIRSKRVNLSTEIETSSNKGIRFIYNDSEKAYAKGKWKFIVLCSFIYLFHLIFFVTSLGVKTNCVILYILSAAIFYYLIFKIKLYKHHYLSIILILSFGLIIDLVTGNLIDELKNKPLKLIAKFLKEIFSSLYNVIAKYTMEKNYITVYEFSFYVGIFFGLFYVIFAIFDYYYFKIYDYDSFFINFDSKELLVILGIIFTQLVINITTLFTAKYNTPCHLFIIFIIGQFAFYINFEGYAPLIIICLIIILFFSLIFNEIIEINVCGLSYDTKRNIISRAENEISRIETNDEKSEIVEK